MYIVSRLRQLKSCMISKLAAMKNFIKVKMFVMNLYTYCTNFP